jgi:hypothetical protein
MTRHSNHIKLDHWFGGSIIAQHGTSFTVIGAGLLFRVVVRED